MPSSPKITLVLAIIARPEISYLFLLRLLLTYDAMTIVMAMSRLLKPIHTFSRGDLMNTVMPPTAILSLCMNVPAGRDKCRMAAGPGSPLEASAKTKNRLADRINPSMRSFNVSPFPRQPNICAKNHLKLLEMFSIADHLLVCDTSE